jgi:hypothetical protein
MNVDKPCFGASEFDTLVFCGCQCPMSNEAFEVDVL